MQKHRRILIVAREQEGMERTTRILEGDGHIVTGTLNDAVAIDMAGSSNFDALVLARSLPLADRGYVAREVSGRQPSIIVVMEQSPQSVLIQLRQAYKERQSELAE